jgi:hypothetical protein
MELQLIQIVLSILIIRFTIIELKVNRQLIKKYD